MGFGVRALGFRVLGLGLRFRVMGFTLGLPNSVPFFSEEGRVQAVTSALQNTGIHIDSMKSYVSEKPQVSANANEHPRIQEW